MIYHLARKAEWESSMEAGVYHGTAEDHADGFLHFSTAEQVAESARKHRAGERDLILLFVDEDALDDKLVWEPSRGGQLFPHLYASLQVAAVVKTADLPLDESGIHIFPEDMPGPHGPGETR